MNEILTFLAEHYAMTIIGAVTLVQIVPIKINPWSWLGRTVKHFFIGGIDTQLSDIKKEVDGIRDIIEERDAVLARTHILRFNDECLNGIHHTNEYFLQTLDDIQTYDKYCEKHPEFSNGRTLQAAENIRRTYERLFDNHKLGGVS